jgi:Ca2+-binding RTX toxin-like protein
MIQMATVKLWGSADMADLPSAGSVSAVNNDTNFFEVYIANRYVFATGNFPSAGKNGSISTVEFNIDTGFALATDIEITGLSFPMTTSYFNGVILDGNFLGFITDLLAGSDTLIGSSGNDHLVGFAGSDVLIGGGAEDGDILTGVGGTDTASYANATAGVSASLDFREENTGDADGDTYNSIENLVGSRFSDNLEGSNSSANTLNGGLGNDALSGRAGNDILIGGLGKDFLQGVAGADRFDFNSKSETVRGTNRDTIFDFSRGQGDKIDLRDIDADTSANPGNDAFKFIGTAAFKGGGGELRCSGGIIQGDTNGDKVADFEIKVNLSTMQQGDFLL